MLREGEVTKFRNWSIRCGKDLAEGEKVLVIKGITKVKTNKSIAERINRYVMTEIGESVRIFGKILQRGNLGLIAVVQNYYQQAKSNKRNNFQLS